MENSGSGFSIIENSNSFLEIRAPAGDETWARGTNHYISWGSRAIEGYLKIIIRKNAEEIESINNIPVMNKRYSWTVPADFEDRSDYTVSVCYSNASIESTSRPFTVSENSPAKKK